MRDSWCTCIWDNDHSPEISIPGSGLSSQFSQQALTHILGKHRQMSVSVSMTANGLWWSVLIVLHDPQVPIPGDERHDEIEADHEIL